MIVCGSFSSTIAELIEEVFVWKYHPFLKISKQRLNIGK